jgi:hypothetical protein
MTADFHAGGAVAEFMRKGNDEVFMRRCTICRTEHKPSIKLGHFPALLKKQNPLHVLLLGDSSSPNASELLHLS